MQFVLGPQKVLTLWFQKINSFRLFELQQLDALSCLMLFEIHFSEYVTCSLRYFIDMFENWSDI